MEMPYRTFRADVRTLTRLSPSFLRVTFTGDDLDAFADHGRDQRIKLIFPAASGGFARLTEGPDWYARWRELPAEHQPPFRTYTVRAVRQEAREVDVDLVLHGDGGPAARWANRATVGDTIRLLGPNARYAGDPGGIEFRPHHPAAPLLLAGDETAVPAVASILAGLPSSACGEALLEVPYPDDALPLTAPAGMKVTWLARDGAAHGSLLVPAVAEAADRLAPAPPPARSPASEPLEEVDVDTGILWEVPAPVETPAGVYAWLAGEAGVIKTLRRHLVAERGWDRRTVAFMGYWRSGRAEAA
ncbi:siderophore-interacting protein [Dactylosporangium roseum]|uniref:Siderophore-interacting protein n=1 Tax=Dactylosporangium roseum TaxID=47989 RepID=A0ABY5YW48_9ACTN|nr:siderophore-interacting protein [Dactylosporangium roseum]UWZ33971.1 siderophore-interacting protein [Dactylosporangium roseum]